MQLKKKIRIIILIFALALTLGFIWGNSLKPVRASLESSGGLFDRVKPIFDALFGEGNFKHSDFRKLAHFCEFFLLGFEVSLLFLELNWLKIEKAYQLSTVGLIISVIDESLQMITDRGPAIIDVLVDCSGYLSAVLFICFISLIVSVIKNKRKNKNKKEKVVP
ncbi:MAG: hypothetical protein E7347_05875 [Clostridiales bacterium]|nr:hypothetical protein [Clostridiales bacterium]